MTIPLDAPYLLLWWLLPPLTLLAWRGPALELSVKDTYLVIGREYLAAGVALRLGVDGLAYYLTRSLPLSDGLVHLHVAGTLVFCLGCATVTNAYCAQLAWQGERWRAGLLFGVLLAGVVGQVSLLINLLMATL